MFGIFYPDEYVDSAYLIKYEDLYEKGYRGIIYDIDNTLVRHGEPASRSAIALFWELNRIGFKTILLSNNEEDRVRNFHDEVGAPYIFKAGKPGTKNYIKAMEIMGTDTSNTLFIGDQLFTDIWGAKRSGIKAYLVRPIHPKEEIQIILKRHLERIVLSFYFRKKRKELIERGKMGCK